jgi:hypothetical protein
LQRLLEYLDNHKDKDKDDHKDKDNRSNERVNQPSHELMTLTLAPAADSDPSRPVQISPQHSPMKDTGAALTAALTPLQCDSHGKHLSDSACSKTSEGSRGKTKRSKSKFIPLNLFEEQKGASERSVPPPLPADAAAPTQDSIPVARSSVAPWSVRPTTGGVKASLSEVTDIDTPLSRGKAEAKAIPHKVPQHVKGSSPIDIDIVSQAGTKEESPRETLTVASFIVAKAKKPSKTSSPRPDAMEVVKKDAPKCPALCPWASPPSPSPIPIPIPVSSTSAIPTPHKQRVTIASTTSPISKMTFEDIIKEEEKCRNESTIKTLQGNSIPWLIDRKNHRSLSLGDVMESQKEERERLQEQIDVEEAIAAVQKLEDMENKKRRRKEEKEVAKNRNRGSPRQIVNDSSGTTRRSCKLQR